MQNTNGTVEMSEPLKDVIRELNQPQTANALKNLARNAQILDLLVQSLEGVLRRGDEITDNISESLREFTPETNGNGHSDIKLLEEMPELLGNLPTLAKAGNKISKLAATEDFDALLQPKNLKFLKNWSSQLAKPEVSDSLEKLVKHLPTLVFMVESIDGLLRRGEEITENISDSIREFMPKTGANVQLAGLTKVAAQLPKVLPPLMKSLPEIAENLPPLLEQSPKLIKTGIKLGEIADSEGVQAFLESDMLTPDLVHFLGDTGKIVVETKRNFSRKPEKLSIWGLYKKTGDEDVQRGLGFLMELAKNFGQMLNENDSRRALNSSDRKALND